MLYGTRNHGGVGLIEVPIGGPRRSSEIYDIAEHLKSKLSDEKSTQLCGVLQLVERTAEKVGLAPRSTPVGTLTSLLRR